ncbi:unnamed protein product, partial [Meganyctiphanes norvegica]
MTITGPKCQPNILTVSLQKITTFLKIYDVFFDQVNLHHKPPKDCKEFPKTHAWSGQDNRECNSTLRTMKIAVNGVHGTVSATKCNLACKLAHCSHGFICDPINKWDELCCGEVLTAVICNWFCIRYFGACPFFVTLQCSYKYIQSCCCQTINSKCEGYVPILTDKLYNFARGFETRFLGKIVCRPVYKSYSQCVPPISYFCATDSRFCQLTICYPTCGNNGTCTAPNTCTCDIGYEGDHCQKPICDTPCSIYGHCTAPNTCSCEHGYEGNLCEQPICDPDCGNYGTCVFPYSCSCRPGYYGDHCQYVICDPPCANNGNCTCPNRCTCEPGYEGNYCQHAICDPPCIQGHCTAPNVCDCEYGYEGDFCQEAICNPSCENHGNCTAPNICNCTDEYEGNLCQQAICNKGCINGKCAMPDDCMCNVGWLGNICNLAICDPGCENGGRCVFPYSCLCRDGYYGDHCQYVYNPSRPIVPGVVPISGYCLNLATGVYDVEQTTKLTDTCNIFVCTVEGWITLSIDRGCCIFEDIGYPKGYTLTEYHSDNILTCVNGEWSDNSTSMTTSPGMTTFPGMTTIPSTSTTTPCWSWCTFPSTTTTAIPLRNYRLEERTTSASTTPAWCATWCDYDY